MVNNRVVKDLPTIITIIGLFCLSIYMFYPGIMNADSADQLLQARLFKFSDWHPPIMSLVWFLLNHIHDGVEIMLVFHNLIFWGALLLFSFFIVPNSNLYRILFILFFGLFPTILVQLGTVFKDSAMSLSLFLASVLLLYAARIKGSNRSRWSGPVILTVAVVFLFYGFAVRLNSAPAVFVLCLWFGDILTKKNIFKKIIIAMVLFLSLFAAKYVITENILHPIKTYPFQQVQAHDLAAISLDVKEPIFPEYVLGGSIFGIDKLRRTYSPLNVAELLFGDNKSIRLSNKAVDIQSLNKVWLKAIYNHPWSYLKHRIKVFNCVVSGCVAFWSDICRVSLVNFHFNPKFIYRLYCNVTLNGPLAFLFHSWVYLINSLVIAVVAIKMRKKLADYKPIMYLLASGFLYVAASFFYAPACEFRYIYWEVIASMMALFLLIKDVFVENGKQEKNTN